MKVELTQAGLEDLEADAIAIAVFEGDDLPDAVAGARGSGDVKQGFKKVTVVHPEAPGRVIVLGLGPEDEMTAERARVAGALAASTAEAFDAESLALVGPGDGEDAAIAAGLVTGAILDSFRFDRFREPSEDEPAGRLTSLTVTGPAGIADDVEAARVTALAQNRTRELQSLPANFATPTYLADRATEIAAAHDSVTTEAFGPVEISEMGMGGLEAVSQGGEEEPRLIVLRYSGGGGEPLGLVGKAVTFDTGGISLKPGAGMDEMKMDMSGGAAVIEAVGAIAELELPIDVIAVVPATENMPSGTAIKPGDVITQYGGKTVEVNNTDAEGRLILADALGYCIELGATRIVDIATLTGAVVVALGSSYAGLASNDDGLAEVIEAAGDATGELVWRLPLHPEYTELMKGKVADLSNLASKRKAGTLTAAAFLAEFVGETPWAHLDIAGTGWDVGREYVGSGPSGFGARLLVELARRSAA